MFIFLPYYLEKGYRCDNELILSTNDLEELIKVLNEFREENKNENWNLWKTSRRGNSSN